MAALAAPAASRGGTSVGDAGPAGAPAGGARTFVQAATAVGEPSYAVPAPGGVLSSWTAVVGAVEDHGLVKLKLLRPSGGGYLVVGSDTQEARGAPVPTTYSTRLAAATGDLLGISTDDVTTVGLIGSQDLESVVRFDPGDPLPPGSFAPALSAARTRLALAAVLEPDADGDGYGDDSQDPCPDTPDRHTLPCSVPLTLSQTVAPASVFRGAEATFVATVVNEGAAVARAITLANELPAGIAALSASATEGSCAIGTGVRCGLGNIAPGATRRVDVRIVALGSGEQTATATVAGGAGEPLAGRLRASATLGVAEPSAPLAGLYGLDRLATGPDRDSDRPILSGVRAVPATFRVGARLPRLVRASRAGTTIRFALSEPATIRLSFGRARPGRRAGGRCRVGRARPGPGARCVRYTTVRPTVALPGARAGQNSVLFQGRLTLRRALRPGRHRLTLNASDAAGNRSRPVSVRLTLRRRTGTG